VSEAFQALFDELTAQGWEVKVFDDKYWLFPPDGGCVYHGIIGGPADANRLRWKLLYQI